MMGINRERKLFICNKIFLSFFRRLRNITFSLSFSTKGMVVGRGVVIVGSKQIHIGQGVMLGNYMWIDAIANGRVTIGDNVSFSQSVHIAAINRVDIGDGCLIGSDVLITDHDHGFGDKYRNIPPKCRPLNSRGPTSLGKNVWLSDNVKVLSGVSLGDNVVVAANSVVTKSFSSNLLIAGSPAKVVRAI